MNFISKDTGAIALLAIILLSCAPSALCGEKAVPATTQVQESSTDATDKSTATPAQQREQIVDEQDELYGRQKSLPPSEYANYTNRLLQLLKKQETAFGMESPQVSCTLDQLYSIYHLQRRPDLQIPVARRSLEIHKRILGPQAVDTAYVTCHLANALSEMGKYEEALSLLQSSLKQVQPTDTHSAETMLTFEIGQTYFDWNRFDEAQPWFDKAVQLKLTYAPNSRVYPNAFKVKNKQQINQRRMYRFHNRFSTNATNSRS